MGDYHDGDGGYFGYNGDDYGPVERVEDNFESRLRYREAKGNLALRRRAGYTSPVYIMDAFRNLAQAELQLRWERYGGVYANESGAWLMRTNNDYHEVSVVVGGRKVPDANKPHSWGARFRLQANETEMTWEMIPRPSTRHRRGRWQDIPPADFGLDTTPAKASFEVVKSMVSEFFRWYAPSVEMHRLACAVEEVEITQAIHKWWHVDGGKEAAEADIWASIERGDEKPFPAKKAKDYSKEASISEKDAALKAHEALATEIKEIFLSSMKGDGFDVKELSFPQRLPYRFDSGSRPRVTRMVEEEGRAPEAHFLLNIDDQKVGEKGWQIRCSWVQGDDSATALFVQQKNTKLASLYGESKGAAISRAWGKVKERYEAIAKEVNQRAK